MSDEKCACGSPLVNGMCGNMAGMFNLPKEVLPFSMKPIPRSTLSERLKDWQDFDVAEYSLGVVLGLFKEEVGKPIFDCAPKWIFWSNNPLGNVLSIILQQLCAIGVLETNEETQFRWKGCDDSFCSDKSIQQKGFKPCAEVTFTPKN
jgi:hypothetical protein